jgi:hypothetical protein
MRLRDAIASDEYRRELATRRENLAPKGLWAVSWAYCFHGWRPQKSASR